MTSTFKQYVELDDLLNVVAACTHCHASLTLPLGGSRLHLPYKCPSCQEPWHNETLRDATIGTQLTDFYVALGHLRRAFDKSAQPLSVALQIEIKSASRASAEPSNLS